MNCVHGFTAPQVIGLIAVIGAFATACVIAVCIALVDLKESR